MRNNAEAIPHLMRRSFFLEIPTNRSDNTHKIKSPIAMGINELAPSQGDSLNIPELGCFITGLACHF